MMVLLVELIPSFFLLPENIPFLIAIGVTLAISILEMLAFFVGFTISSTIDVLIPDFEIDIDASFTNKVFGWLQVGRVPSIMLLILYLSLFGMIGLGVQLLSHTFYETFPWYVATMITFPTALVPYKYIGGKIAALIPDDESDAISEEELTGVAELILGRAAFNFPGEAKLVDKNGKTHYIMIEPERGADAFHKGDKVIIHRRDGRVYRGVKVDYLN